MKYFKYIALGWMLTLSTTSCEEWLDVNVDPDSPNNESALVSNRLPWIQKFYMYLKLTKPSQRLILSWSLADADGKSLRPSWLIASIKELFPKVDIRT